MSIEHTTRAITENKYMMQIFADKQSLQADIRSLRALKTANPTDSRASDYIIKQKEYELSQIESRIKGKDYKSVKSQCEQYFRDNTDIDSIKIIAETKEMLSRGQIVNEWPHLAAVFLLDHTYVTSITQAGLASVTAPRIVTPAVVSIAVPVSSVPVEESLSPKEIILDIPAPTTRPVPAPTTRPVPAPTLTTRQTPPLAPNTTGDASLEMFKTQQTMVFKDGAYYLTGPKGNTKRVDMKQLLVNLNLQKDAPENLQKSVSLIQDFALILDAYLLKNPDKKPQYDATLKGIQMDFANLDVQSGKTIVDIKKWTPTLFGNNNFLKDSDLYTINRAIETTDPKARKFAILTFIRDRLGQSDLALQNLIAGNMSVFGFPIDDEIVKNGDLSSTKLDAKQITTVRKAIDAARTEANSNWIKNKDNYLQAWKSENPGKSVDTELARATNEKLTILMSAKREIVYQNLYNKTNLPQELALLQNIIGAGSMKMSDKSWEISTEIAGMIGMEAVAIAAGVVTAGAGTVLINTLAFGRNAYKGAKALEAYSAASKTKQALTTSARIIGGGAAFEAGGATARSLIENGDLTSMHSKEGYAQSIAMMGVLSGIGKLISAGKLGTGIQFKDGAGFAKNILPFAGQVAIEGSAIFGTSAAIGSVFFDRRDNWTMEQMAQAMLMATMFKGAGRLSAGKNKNGEIEVKKSTEEVVSHGKNQIIPEGTLKSEPAKASNNIVNISEFTTREIIATDVRRAKNLIKNGKYPQFIAEDGSIWSMRSVTGKSGSEMVEIGPLGGPSVARKATIQEFVEGVNTNIRKFKNGINTTTTSPTAVDPHVQPIITVAESLPTPKIENKTEPVQPKETPDGKVKEQPATVSSETLTKQATNPHAAESAIESVSHSSRKIGETFSKEWLENISHMIGKPIKWIADQSVGPIFRMVTGNNPGALISLANPMGAWTGKASTYGKNFLEHWKNPVRNSINLLVTGERKDGQGAIGSIAKNVIFAGGITALDYFAVPNNQANTPANMAQNYYEMILLGWLGVVLMEIGPIKEGAKDAKDWISDRLQAKPF